MKVTVVGFWGGYPAVGEATSSYLIEHDDFKLLVDCGSGSLAQLQRYVKPEEVDAIILSHYHHDHIADIGVFQYARLIQSHLGNSVRELPIYGHTYDEQVFSKLTHPSITKGVGYDPEKPLEIGPFTIEFLKTKHPVTCFAMRIRVEDEAVVYTADSSYIEEFVSFSKNADLLICECNFYSHQDGSGAGHMTSIEAGKLAQKAQVNQLMLTHLPHYGDHNQLIEEAKQEFLGSVVLAKTGFQWSHQEE
ncbi:MBL fold metallo-hydrolase [Priestia megaterium]|nr:MBL fold metallo-hydrolase [Priestia megaterium]